MHEIVMNLHMHTGYSDGSGSHKDIARAALNAGLDAVLVTDHNVQPRGLDGYHSRGGRRILILLGEEIHDRTRTPQKNHMLVFGASHELAGLAQEPHALLAAAAEQGALTFLAHPVDPEASSVREPDISWVDWSIAGYTGIELWNGFSELKAHIPTRLHGVLFAYFPALMACGPLPATMRLWDQLLGASKTVAIGGGDAHALRLRLGFLRRTVFPYSYHFRAINTHVLLPSPLSGNADGDALAIYAAIRAGHCFIGYELPGRTNGFRFFAGDADHGEVMGDEVRSSRRATLTATAPKTCDLTVLKDGKVISAVRGDQISCIASEPGVYRVEAHRHYLGRRRAWIISNPIYVV